MIEKTLFGIIVGLLVSVSGVGAYAAVKNPDAVTLLPGEAISVVASALSDTAEVLDDTLAPAEDSEMSEDASVSMRGDSDDDDDGDEEDAYEDDEDDEQDDDRGGARTTVAVTAASQQTSSQTQGGTPSTTASFTMQQVAVHNSAASCYSAISGSVYDLTPFVGRHPGGAAAIKSLCGVDGTAAFTGQHGGQGRPVSELASLKIGVLAQ